MDNMLEQYAMRLEVIPQELSDKKLCLVQESVYYTISIIIVRRTP